MSMTRTIRRNMIRQQLGKEGRRHYNGSGRERDKFGNKLPSVFSAIWKKSTGQKKAKVKKCSMSERR